MTGMTRWDRLVLKVASRLLSDLTKRRIMLAIRVARYEFVSDQERAAVGWAPDRTP